MTTEATARRVIPNFKDMTEHELYGFAQSEHELAPVANYVLELRQKLASTPVIDASGPVRIVEADPRENERAPDGYAYRYHDCIRFNGGIEVNGGRPTEAIPYYFGDPVRSSA
jgi:hypothetical protein